MIIKIIKKLFHTPLKMFIYLCVNTATVAISSYVPKKYIKNENFDFTDGINDFQDWHLNNIKEYTKILSNPIETILANVKLKEEICKYLKTIQMNVNELKTKEVIRESLDCFLSIYTIYDEYATEITKDLISKMYDSFGEAREELIKSTIEIVMNADSQNKMINDFKKLELKNKEIKFTFFKIGLAILNRPVIITSMAGINPLHECLPKINDGPFKKVNLFTFRLKKLVLGEINILPIEIFYQLFIKNDEFVEHLFKLDDKIKEIEKMLVSIYEKTNESNKFPAEKTIKTYEFLSEKIKEGYKKTCILSGDLLNLLENDLILNNHFEIARKNLLIVYSTANTRLDITKEQIEREHEEHLSNFIKKNYSPIEINSEINKIKIVYENYRNEIMMIHYNYYQGSVTFLNKLFDKYKIEPEIFDELKINLKELNEIIEYCFQQDDIEFKILLVHIFVQDHKLYDKTSKFIEYNSKDLTNENEDIKASYNAIIVKIPEAERIKNLFNFTKQLFSHHEYFIHSLFCICIKIDEQIFEIVEIDKEFGDLYKKKKNVIPAEELKALVLLYAKFIFFLKEVNLYIKDQAIDLKNKTKKVESLTELLTSIDQNAKNIELLVEWKDDMIKFLDKEIEMQTKGNKIDTHKTRNQIIIVGIILAPPIVIIVLFIIRKRK